MYRAAREVLEEPLGPHYVLLEFGRRLPVDEFVPPAVRGEFVSGSRDLPHQVGVPGGYPAEHEEGGLYLVLRQAGEQAARVVFHAARE